MTTAARHGRQARNGGGAEHPTLEERIARGRSERSRVPRSAHAELSPGADRPDPVALLERQAQSRLPELVPIRYGRMLVSPFTFLRGAALVMAGDLATTPTTRLTVQLCGDAHLSNFGVFGSPERRAVFDINDFDETLPGPFEWDVKRFATSLEVAGRDRGFADAEREAVVRAGVRRYRTAMADFAGRSNLDVFYARFDVEEFFARLRSTLPPKALRRAEKRLAKARTRDSMQALDRLTLTQDGRVRIAADPPLIVPVRDLLPDLDAEVLSASVRELLRAYRRTLPTDRRRLLERYEYVDLARKVVGVGSVGARAWIVLLMGRDLRDPLFLQIKEAQPSVLEEFAGRSAYRNAGHRVVAGQRLMQAASDVFLGWLRVTDGLGGGGGGRDFYVRQLRDWKGSAEVAGMVPEGMRIYAEMCGWTLARAHARSGDAVAIAAYLGRGSSFDDSIAAFSAAYADRNERDHGLLRQAVASGRVEARTGL
jgi:uncharacterized protein (DUF2252 family)